MKGTVCVLLVASFMFLGCQHLLVRETVYPDGRIEREQPDPAVIGLIDRIIDLAHVVAVAHMADAESEGTDSLLAWISNLVPLLPPDLREMAEAAIAAAEDGDLLSLLAMVREVEAWKAKNGELPEDLETSGVLQDKGAQHGVLTIPAL